MKSNGQQVTHGQNGRGHLSNSKEEISRYKFTDIDNGFRITGKDRRPTTITLNKGEYHWHVDSSHNVMGTLGIELSGLTDLRSVVRTAASGLMRDWKSPVDDVYNSWYGARDWSVKNTRPAISNKIKVRMTRLLNEAYDPVFVGMLRKFYAHTFRNMPPEMAGLIHSGNDHYLISDITKYRAAAHAVANWGVVIGEAPNPNHKNWMHFYCYMNRDNSFGPIGRSKRRTIMNMPGGISMMTSRQLRHMEMDRPLFGRTQFIWACILKQKFVEWGLQADPEPYMYASEEDIKRAFTLYARLSNYYGYFSPRRTKHHIVLAQYIVDAFNYDGGVGYATTVTGALRRSHELHRLYMPQHGLGLPIPRVSITNNTDPSRETALPPIDLPDRDGIRFLRTVKDVLDEGENMLHCIDGYWSVAVKGTQYLFHIEYEGEEATASVSAETGYVQCLGPSNVINAASEYGGNALTAWARSLPNGMSGLRPKDFAVLPQGRVIEFEEIPY